jgi:biopolymer transport protein ExbD
MASEAATPTGAQAQLILAFLLLALCPIFLLTYPPRTHIVRLDLMQEEEEPPPPGWKVGGALAFSTMVTPPPPRLHLPSEHPAAGDPVHTLEVTAEGRILVDGEEVDFTGLRTRLDWIAVEKHWIDYRPDPDARYELFLEVLAVTKRAGLERLRLGHSRFIGAIEGLI